MDEPPRFIADEMNGDVAKWLRIIGFDCLYLTGENLDNKLIEIALSENRILLTSDRELYKRIMRKGGYGIYTQGVDTIEKLKEIFQTLELTQYIGKIKYRCTNCNTPLKERESNSMDRIPQRIKEQYKIIFVCEKCGKIYWKGSHWRNITKTLHKLGIYLY
jgi:hypothetical protein